MALSHKHRTALYEGLSGIVDEEAVNAMSAYFPTREGDEPISREFLRAEMPDLRCDQALNRQRRSSSTRPAPSVRSAHRCAPARDPAQRRARGRRG